MDKYIIDGVEYCQGEMVEVRDDITEEWHTVRLSGVNGDAAYKIISKNNIYLYIRKLQPKIYNTPEEAEPHKYQEVIDLIENLSSVAVDSTKNILVESKEVLLEKIKNLK